MSIVAYTPGNFPTYRFFLTYHTLTYEVFPLKFNDSSLVESTEGDELFYRNKFSGSLIFGTNSEVPDESGVVQNRKDDFDLLWAIEQLDPCETLYFTIEKTVNGTTETYWEGLFSTTDGEFDIDKCLFEVTPEVNDDYTDILKEVDLQYNILSAGSPVTTIMRGIFSVNYTRNRWITDVIDYLANLIKPGCNTSYTIFTAATNYVTLDTNHLDLLTIAQKSDIRYPASTDPSTTAMMSWTELMNILRSMFQIYWNYDAATDTINVEHISWSGFAPSPGIDLRTQLSTQSTNKYSYLKTSMPKYEKFVFMEANNVNFIGYPIWYDSSCVNQDTKSNIKELSLNVTTDIEYINSNVDDISSDGYVILCNYLDGGNYYVEYQKGKLVADFKPNMRLSWANLQDSYFRHNRVLLEGYLNGVLTDFWTAQKTKKQDCSAILCATFDSSEEITTELGETYFAGTKARVKEATLKPSGETKFNLIYGPADNVNTGIADEKIVYLFQQDDCFTFIAIFSIPPTAMIRLSVRAIITYGEGGDCTCNWTQFTWAAGTHYASGTVTNDGCTGFNPDDGDCVNFEWDDSLMGDFDYETIPYELSPGEYPCGC